jgi:hypothetical protein
MRILLALVLFTSMPIKQVRACHHFTRWYYKFPQSCRDVQYLPPQHPTSGGKSWYVEVVPTDDDLHNIGIEKLKRQQEWDRSTYAPSTYAPSTYAH